MGWVPWFASFGLLASRAAEQVADEATPMDPRRGAKLRSQRQAAVPARPYLPWHAAIKLANSCQGTTRAARCLGKGSRFFLARRAFTKTELSASPAEADKRLGFSLATVGRSSPRDKNRAEGLWPSNCPTGATKALDLNGRSVATDQAALKGCQARLRLAMPICDPRGADLAIVALASGLRQRPSHKLVPWHRP